MSTKNNYIKEIELVQNEKSERIELGTPHLIETTYNEIVSLISEDGGNGNLIVGAWYQITDYNGGGTFEDNNMSSEGHQFDILVHAVSKNKISYECKCVPHSDNETYFDKEGILKWKIWYTLDDKREGFYTGGAKGVIYRMIDEFGNDCPYDFKNITYHHEGIKYYTFYNYQNADRLYDSTVIKKGDTPICTNNIIKPYKEGFNKIRCCCLTSLHNNFIGENSHEIILGDGCVNNHFKGGNCDINMGNDCTNNIIGYNSSTKIILEDKCNNNTIGNSSTKIELKSECNNNTIGNSSKQIKLENKCNNNTIGNNINSYSNIDTIYILSSSSFNFIGDECRNIIIKQLCLNNKILNECKNISLSDKCSFNEIGKCSDSVRIGNDCKHNYIGSEVLRINILNNCTNNCVEDNCGEIKINEYSYSNKIYNKCYYVELGGSNSRCSNCHIYPQVNNIILCSEEGESYRVSNVTIYGGYTHTSYIGDKKRIEIPSDSSQEMRYIVDCDNYSIN